MRPLAFAAASRGVDYYCGLPSTIERRVTVYFACASRTGFIASELNQRTASSLLAPPGLTRVCVHGCLLIRERLAQAKSSAWLRRIVQLNNIATHGAPDEVARSVQWISSAAQPRPGPDHRQSRKQLE